MLKYLNKNHWWNNLPRCTNYLNVKGLYDPKRFNSLRICDLKVALIYNLSYVFIALIVQLLIKT